MKKIEPLLKLPDERENRHSGQTKPCTALIQHGSGYRMVYKAKLDPESRIFKRFWIPALAGHVCSVEFVAEKVGDSK